MPTNAEYLADVPFVALLDDIERAALAACTWHGRVAGRACEEGRPDEHGDEGREEPAGSPMSSTASAS